MELVLARPRGFCAGVNRAIAIVNKALEIHGGPVYVLHEIVHNTHVINDLQKRGAHFVERLEEIPAGAVTIFSAHGVSRAIITRAAALQLRTIDATCPLVAKVHRQVRKLNDRGYEVVVIGHKGHPEVEGTCGHAVGTVHVISMVEDVYRLDIADEDQVGYVTQTTLSVDDTREILSALRQCFPRITEPRRTDICYATTNRQEAVRKLAAEVDIVLVVGSKNSSNSNRLREVAEHNGIPAYLIDHAEEINASWLNGVQRVGVTAGASAPEYLVNEVLEWFSSRYRISMQEMEGLKETICFQLPELNV
ncbi:MAG: 4-hydroxy-3-methylbut-2-enyl diphosphate reductase [Desulfobulbus propionicus]|nr:MAG: 4-hydroxy-3-methylbut-2-enyl diphosphate reductase [Desulfobulbus propionicus]